MSYDPQQTAPTPREEQLISDLAAIQQSARTPSEEQLDAEWTAYKKKRSEELAAIKAEHASKDDRGDKLIAELRALRRKRVTAPIDEQPEIAVDLAIKNREFEVHFARRDRRGRIREILEEQQRLYRQQESYRQELAELFSDADDDLGFLVGLLEKQLQELSVRFDKELQQRKD